MTQNEVWKPVPGYLNYKVSNLGRVKSISRIDSKGELRKGKILSPIKTKGGYLKVNLSENGERKEGKIHRLVMAAFVGDCPEGLQVNHIDEDKTNNRADNLEYVTQAQNNNHGTRNKRVSKALTGLKRSEESRKRIKAAARMRARPVVCVETGETFETIEDASSAVGIKQGVGHVCRGYQQTAGGYHWRYA